MKEKFYCDQCGLCCKSISYVPELKNFDRGDGVCQHLSEEGLCLIYDTRPEICRVDEMYEKYFSKTMSREEFYRENMKVCDALKQKFSYNQ